MSLSQHHLIGVWDLAEFRIEFDDGRSPIRPFGDASGQLIYAENGRMSAVLSAEGREPLSVEALERASRAPDAERLAAFDSYTSYTGTYRVEDGAVTHCVEMALMPNIVGREQVRTAVLDGDELTLSYDVPAESGQYHYVLTWHRV